MTHPTPIIRPAVLTDVPEIHAMIHELATFERAASSVKATPESLAATITFAPTASNPDPPQRVAKALVVTVSDSVAATAIYFHNYSTWTSQPGVYLEDLFVRPDYRRRGIATLLLAELGREAEAIAGGREGARLEWSCLRWNEGALAFYRSIGAVTGDEWVKVRCEGSGLGTLQEAAGKVLRE